MPALTPVATTHPPEWHRATLLDFQQKKALIGEPSPHMTVANALSADQPLDERLWRIGCYLVPYSLLSAEVIWKHWSFHQFDADAFRGWLEEHWAGIHTRTERRMVRTPAKFWRSLVSWHEFVASGEPHHLLDSRADYEAWWKAVNRVEFFGRYISIRAIEAIRRDANGHDFAAPELELSDIRSIGGDSPVRALTLFYPDWYHPILLTDPGAADEAAEKLLGDLRAESLHPMSYYVFAAMLCEYREAYEDGHQYPGRTLDQELEYQRKPHAGYWVSRGFGAFETFAARRRLFPLSALGEVSGWPGIRPELSHLLRDYGTVWSDVVYDYRMSDAGSGALTRR